MRLIHYILLGLFFIALSWSAYDNADWFIWKLEVAPGVLAVIVLALTFKKFRFTTVAYIFILMHCVILFIGAKYTYAEVPLFNWLRDLLDMSRNNYDKVGHFAQGFVPALVSREILIRLKVINGRGWLQFFVICFCLAMSALYELVEWFVAEVTGEAADAFLGTQGYVWDTQSDMFWALAGACSMFVLLSRVHDRAMTRLEAAEVSNGKSG
jgi:Predicted membrane protein